MDFDLETERIKQAILKQRAKRILLQLPEGLRSKATLLADLVERTGATSIISADPCYGACDLAVVEARCLGVDMIVHFGHSKFVSDEGIPTIYIEAKAIVSVDKTIEKALHLLKEQHKIGLAATVQHVQVLDSVREKLVGAGKTVMIGDVGRLSYAGQVTGCDYSNARSIADKVDVFLVIAGGKFHALGLALATSKSTIAADPYENRAYFVDQEAKLVWKRRWAMLEQAREASRFGILVGLKAGQRRLEKAFDLKDKLAKNGKNAYVFAAREITPEIVLNFPSVDVFVNTACPRVSIDDSPGLRKPILTIGEALVVVGEVTWEQLCRRGLLES